MFSNTSVMKKGIRIPIVEHNSFGFPVFQMLFIAYKSLFCPLVFFFRKGQKQNDSSCDAVHAFAILIYFFHPA